jgi:hypothetical protein
MILFLSCVYVLFSTTEAHPPLIFAHSVPSISKSETQVLRLLPSQFAGESVIFYLLLFAELPLEQNT